MGKENIDSGDWRIEYITLPLTISQTQIRLC